MRKNPKIKILNFKSKEDFSFLRLTLDEKEDEVVLKNVYKYFNKKKKNFFHL